MLIIRPQGINHEPQRDFVLESPEGESFFSMVPVDLVCDLAVDFTYRLLSALMLSLLSVLPVLFRNLAGFAKTWETGS